MKSLIIKTIKQSKVLLILPFTFFSLSSNADMYNENDNIDTNFNLSKLEMVCNVFSNEKKSCINEILKLKKTSTENSTVRRCFTSYNSLMKFSNCLKYENNPLTFLQFQKNKTIPLSRVSKIKKDIIVECSKHQNISLCVKENYLLIERAVNPANWIENYCVYKENELYKINRCYENIKASSLNENVTVNSIPNLMFALDQWTSKFDTRINNYFTEIYKECSSKYSLKNIFPCIETKMNNNINILNNINTNNLKCFKYKNYKDFTKCNL